MNVNSHSTSIASESIVTLTRKGQVTIPAAVRRLLGFPSQGKVSLVVNEASKTAHLQVPRYPTIASLAGAAGKLDHPIPLKEMLEIARAEALDKKHSAKPHE